MYCAGIGLTKRRAYADETYWTRPVTGFGDTRARIWIIGLAPGAHGANRTGRVFTGDRSGDFLFAALHRVGLASQSASSHRNDGLRLRDVYISASVRCAPPGNKPLPGEVIECSPYLDREFDLLRGKKVLLALGGIAWRASLDLLARHDQGAIAGRFAESEAKLPQPKFAHGACAQLADVTLLGSYHVSQQNTFTGRLTEVMFDSVLRRAIAIADGRANIRPSG
ncbi:MAG TPA: uracil-DNA glycosylase [Tepidisphaeraceae bacterium]|nr:uracil-DNA glycosylase [Tepidisphaeraceae bacterium]